MKLPCMLGWDTDYGEGGVKMDKQTAKLMLKALRRSTELRLSFKFEIDNSERAELINLISALEIGIEAIEKAQSEETE